MAWYRGWAIYIYRLYRYGIGQAYTYHTSDIELLKQRYLQLKVYLCLAEIPDCLVILMSSWHISSLLQGVASGNQSTLSDVLFTKHTSSNKHQVIQHLATKSPANPLPTSSTVAEAASVAGTVFSCEFASEETATREEMLSTSLQESLSCWLLQFQFSISMILICYRCRYYFNHQGCNAEIESLEPTTWAPARSPCSPACPHPGLYDV